MLPINQQYSAEEMEAFIKQFCQNTEDECMVQ